MKSTSPRLKQTDVYEIDDILVTRFLGDYTLELAVALQARTNALAARYGYRLILLDVRWLGAVTPETRRYLVEDQQRERKDSSIAIVGANFAIRTLATLIVHGIGALTKLPAALKFFETEELALAWLEQERNRLRTAGVSTKLT